MRGLLIAGLALSACAYKPADRLIVCADGEDEVADNCVRFVDLGGGIDSGGDASINVTPGDPGPPGDSAGGDTDINSPCPNGQVFIVDGCFDDCGGGPDPCSRGTCYRDPSSSQPTCECEYGYAGQFCGQCAPNFRSGVNGCEPTCDPSALCNSGGSCAGNPSVCVCEGWMGCGAEATCLPGSGGVDDCSCSPGYQDNDPSGACYLDCNNTAASFCTEPFTDCFDDTGAPTCVCIANYSLASDGQTCGLNCSGGCASGQLCLQGVCECLPNHDDVDPNTPGCEPTCATAGCDAITEICVEEPGVGAVCKPCVFFADNAADGQDDGSSWEDAYENFESLLFAFQAVGAADGCEIWLAAGTYDIDGSLRTDGVILQTGMSIRGGFTANANDQAQRNLLNERTVLTGVNDARHVLFVEGDDVLIDGLVVTGGMAFGTGELDRRGGGIYVANGTTNLTVRDVLIEDNTAEDRGGGLAADGSNGLRLIGVGFADNEALNGANAAFNSSDVEIERSVFTTGLTSTPLSGLGSGVFAISSSDVQIFDSAFTGNRAIEGSAIYATANSEVSAERVVILSNSPRAVKVAGGGNKIVLSRALLANNFIDVNAGGAVVVSGGEFRAYGSTFYANDALSSGIVAVVSNGSAYFTSSLLLSDNPNDVSVAQGTIELRYSLHSAALCQNGCAVTAGGGPARASTADFADPISGVFDGTWTLGAQGGFPIPTTRLNISAIGQQSGGLMALSTLDGEYVIVGAFQQGNGWVDVVGHQTLPPSGSYELIDLSPAAGSPLVDAGEYDASMAWDLKHTPVQDVRGVTNAGTGTVDYADIGAYERLP